MPDIEAIISRVYDQATQSLRISGGVGGGGEAGPWLNIQRNNVEIVPLANNIDFSTDFTVTQSPVGDGNIGIGTTIARQSAIDDLMQGDIPFDTAGFVGNLDPGIILTGQDLADYLDGIDLSGGALADPGWLGNLQGSGVDTTQEFADFFDAFTFPGTGTVESVNLIFPVAGDITLTAFDVSAVDVAELGVAGGVATLDGSGILDLAQWPQFVTDINGYAGGSVNLMAADIFTDDTTFTGNLLGVDPNIQAALQAFNDFIPGATSGHEIREDGTPMTLRAGLNFSPYFELTDDLGNDETDVDLDLTALGTALGTGGAVAPFDATYLTTTSNGSLSNEVVVGTTPGGELGGTWASPTVDATHSGSSHAGVQAAAEATAAAALATVTALDLLVGTATGVLSGEIVVGTTPGGELGGTWASPTVDTTHSGSSHASIQSAAEATAAAALTAHIADLTSAHSATGVDFTPVGSISSTDVQAAIAEVAAESLSATIGSVTQPPYNEFDGTLAPYAPLNTPSMFISSSVHQTSAPDEINEGTPLLIHFDHDLDYSGGTTGAPFFVALGPNYSVPYRPADWSLAPTSFPRGVVTVSGTVTFTEPAGLFAGPVTFMDFRTTKNEPGVAGRITNTNSFLNNHTFEADGASVEWFLDGDVTGGYVTALDNYAGIGFADAPTFMVSNGGVLTSGATASFLSAPQIVDGAHVHIRWGLVISDTSVEWAAVQADGPGTIDRQVGIQIAELVQGDDYNIPINYGDPDVSAAPLFRVESDGSVYTPAIYGLGAFGVLGINPDNPGSSNGSLIIDARNMQLGPIAGYTHTAAANFQLMQVTNPATIVMDSATHNSYGGITLAGTVSFDSTGSLSAMFTATNTFTVTSGVAMGIVYGALVAPAFVGVGTTSVTSVGFSGSPTFTHPVAGTTLTVSNLTTFQSAPTVNDAQVSVSARTGVYIGEIAGSSGTITSNVGIDIEAFTRGGTNIGIRNASTTKLGNSVELRYADATFTATPDWFFVDNTFTLDFASAAVGTFVDIHPSLIYHQAGSAFGAGVYANIRPAVTNNAAVNLGLHIGMANGVVLTAANTFTGTTGSIISYSAAPNLARTGTGTISGTVTNYSSGGVSDTGATISTMTHLAVADVTGSGSVTTQYGIDIPALAKATTNVGIRNAASLVQTGAFFFGASTAAANGDLFTVQGAASYGAGDNRYATFLPTITSNASAGDLTAQSIAPTFTATENTTSTKALNVGPTFTPASGKTITTAIAVQAAATLTGAGTATELIGVQATAFTLGAGSAAPPTATTGIGVDIQVGEVLGLGLMSTGVLLRALTNSATTTKWGFQFGDFQSYHHGKLSLGATTAPTYALDIKGTTADRGVIALTEAANAPTNPSASNQVLMYMKADTLVFSYNDAGTMRYLSIALTGTGVTWTHSTVAI